MPLIIDAHEDLAYNAITFGRSYLRSAAETRSLESGTPIPQYNNGDTLLGWPEYQRGQVAVVFGTLFAAPKRRQAAAWDHLAYQDFNEARKLYLQQVDYYQRLTGEHREYFRQVLSRADLDEILADWGRPLPAREDPRDTTANGHPVGLVTLMEGAEGVRRPEELEEWWGLGVRIIGPAWAGTRFCGGTGDPGPLTADGIALLEAMSDLGFALDISHMDEAAALQALERYEGHVMASHSNAAALLKGIEGNRHLPDRVLYALLERGGVTGILPFNAFLKPGWRHHNPKRDVPLSYITAHIDYVCQMAGDARHVGIGTDFDGGFGMQGTPEGIDTIADLQKLAPMLAEMGYSPEDIEGIFGQNWLRLLKEVLPQT